MERTLTQAAHRTPAFREFTHVVWGYGTLIDRALAADEDVRPLLAGLQRATDRVARWTNG